MLPQLLSLNVRELVKTCSWIVVTPQLRRTGRQEKKNQRPSSHSGPTLIAKFQPRKPPIPIADPIKLGYFMDSCNSTAQKDRAIGEIGPVTELGPGTYALSRSFSHASYIPVEILRPQLPFSTSHGCAAIQWPLKTHALRLVLCAVCGSRLSSN